MRMMFPNAVRRAIAKMKKFDISVDEAWGFKVFPTAPCERPGSREFLTMVKLGDVEGVAT